MNNAKWVQHISGQGEKYRVVSTQVIAADRWFTRAPSGPDLTLPVSEYRECEPPEQWEECTKEIVTIHPCRRELHRLGEYGFVSRIGVANLESGYRWVWKGDALVVERKVP